MITTLVDLFILLVLLVLAWLFIDMRRQQGERYERLHAMLGNLQAWQWDAARDRDRKHLNIVNRIEGRGMTREEVERIFSDIKEHVAGNDIQVGDFVSFDHDRTRHWQRGVSDHGTVYKRADGYGVRCHHPKGVWVVLPPAGAASPVETYGVPDWSALCFGSAQEAMDAVDVHDPMVLAVSTYAAGTGGAGGSNSGTHDDEYPGDVKHSLEGYKLPSHWTVQPMGRKGIGAQRRDGPRVYKNSAGKWHVEPHNNLHPSLHHTQYDLIREAVAALDTRSPAIGLRTHDTRSRGRWTRAGDCWVRDDGLTLHPEVTDGCHIRWKATRADGISLADRWENDLRAMRELDDARLLTEAPDAPPSRYMRESEGG